MKTTRYIKDIDKYQESIKKRLKIGRYVAFILIFLAFLIVSYIKVKTGEWVDFNLIINE